MNTVKEDYSKAAFKLTMEDLDRPLILLDAFQQLLNEVWRYAPPNERASYVRELPIDYVCARFTQLLESDDPQEEKEGLVVRSLTCMAGRGLEPVGNFLLRLDHEIQLPVGPVFGRLG